VRPHRATAGPLTTWAWFIYGQGMERDTPAPVPDPSPDEEARFADRVMRSFVRDGRLVSIPAQDRKRRVILRWLVDTIFIEDRVYPEREVNMRLARVHRDVAALRRYLVDARLMTRAAGDYRRTLPLPLDQEADPRGPSADGTPGAS